MDNFDHSAEKGQTRSNFKIMKEEIPMHLNNSPSNPNSPRHEMFSIYCESMETEFMPNIDPMLDYPLGHIFPIEEQEVTQNSKWNSPETKKQFQELDLLGDILQKIEKEDTAAPQRGCNCKKTMCLKLYCACFSSGVGCGVDCSCTECLNNNENPVIRQIFMEELTENQNNAAKRNSIDDSNFPGESLAGCNCKKTGCSKKYCDCFKYGLTCGPACKCTDCQNGKESVDSRNVNRSSNKLIKKQKKKPMSFNNFVDKFKLFNLLQNSKATESKPADQ